MSESNDIDRDLWQVPWWLKLGGMAGWYTMGLLAVFLVLFSLVVTTATLTVPLLFAAILGAVFSPWVDRLAKRGMKRWLAALGVLFAIVIVSVALFLLVVSGVVKQWPQISASISSSISEVQQQLKASTTPQETQEVQNTLEASADDIIGGLLSYVPQAVSGLFSIGFAVFIGANILFFMLKDGGPIGDALAKHMFIGERFARDLIHDAGTTMRNYMVGVSIVGTFNAVVVGVGALVLGVPLPGTIAIVTFVMAFIPYFGAVVAGAFAVLMALSTGNWTTALIMLVIVFLANGVLQNVVNEYAMKSTLSLNPLLVLVVTTFAGLLFGALGAFLASPVTSIFVQTVNRLQAAGVFDRIQEKGSRLAAAADADVGGPAMAEEE
jgi:putative heme transporter